jgi:small subunit ribosomal protein S17
MKQQLTGTVVSDKMQKTVVVEIGRLKQHPKYFKRFLVSERYKAHDQNSECKVGDKVVIEACRPMSHDKRWKVVKKLAATKKSEPLPKEEL